MAEPDIFDRSALRWLLIGLLAVGGCTAVDALATPAGPAGSGEGGLDDGQGADGLISARVRLLNNVEYNNTVAALLGDTVRPANAFPASTPQLGFINNADQAVGAVHAAALDEAAAMLAANAARDLSRILPCDPRMGESACAAAFVDSFGARAFRRPLTAQDRTDLLAIYTTGRANGADFNAAIEDVIYGVLSSGAFLYVTELGEGDAPQGAEVVLTPHELASALSYFLLASPPDNALLAAAVADKLSTPEQVSNQARRLLADPRSKPQITRFFTEWLQIGPSNKDATIYPTHQALGASFLAETQTLIEDVMFAGDGTLETLLLADYTFVDPPLAQFYGLAPVSGTPGKLTKVDLDTSARLGILGHASLLSVQGNQNSSSPVKRGVFVRRRLLCQELPDPPVGVNVTPPPADPDLTTRQLFAAHGETPGCAGCHKLIDPVGNGFEHFDGQGAYRMTDNGHPVDASGEVTNTLDANGKFEGVPELARRLAQSEEVHGCFARNLFRFGSAQNKHETEATFLAEMPDPLPKSIQDLIVEYVQTRTFRVRVAR